MHSLFPIVFLVLPSVQRQREIQKFVSPRTKATHTSRFCSTHVSQSAVRTGTHTINDWEMVAKLNCPRNGETSNFLSPTKRMINKASIAHKAQGKPAK